MTDSVCFVCRYRNGEYEPVGTGFFVGMPIGNPQLNNFLGLVVTALHVLNEIEGTGQTPDKIYLRVNTKDGGVEHVHIPAEQWARPSIDDQIENGIVDAAVCWFPGNNTTGNYEYLLMPAANEIATREHLEEEGIGIGNEVFFAGLFIRHAETKRNEPIVRAGMISAMPEKIETRSGPQHALLIETRSIGGFSGSPVFVNAGFWRFDDEGQLKLRSNFTRMYYLIGVISGHWEIGEEIQIVGGATERASMNMGIAKVTPMEKVLPLMAESVENFQRHGVGLILKDLSTIGRNFGELIKSLVDATVRQSEQVSSPDASTGQTTSPAESPSTEIRPSEQ
ncbi:hypothetical protein DAVIS_04696 [Mycobacterium marinum]|uniref:Trypsin-like peptidase domain-containing protein n=2 Tax=Mycobacterium marinum TaxID=1781 RepID=A0A3E2MR02_MYCMR|nr:hypothetical protein DAVIS_04696 [Mycobacterium marinum]